MNHQHSDQHFHQPQSFNLAFASAVLINLLYTFAEVTYGLIASSMSLVADAGHNLGDVLGLTLAWFANWLLSKPANAKFSYGYKRTTIIAALFNGLLLMTSALWIAIGAIQKLLHPTPIHELTVIIVAGIGVLVNALTSIFFIKGIHHDLNIKGAFLHLLTDALISLGVVITGVTLMYTHWYTLDPLISLLIATLIIYGSWNLLRESINLIMDGVPAGLNPEDVKLYLNSFPQIQEIHDLHIWGLSTQETALTAHLVTIDGRLDENDHANIRQYLQKHFSINHITIQIEAINNDNPCDNNC